MGWAFAAGEDPVQLLRDFGDRIALLHVKDTIAGTTSWTVVGDGDVDWAGVFRAAQGKVRLDVVEKDFPSDAFSFAEESLAFLDCFTY